MPELKSEIKAVFSINGKQYEVDSSIPPNTSLNTYIRDYANLKGTKAMCHEGGCGACIVMLTKKHPVSKKEQSFAINSCLMPVFSCHNCAVTTIEGIGNAKIGYNTVQKTLAAFNATQCGYCSPGMVMNMYSLLQSGRDVTMEDVENSFGGNICRCTGYRPILDAFKSLCTDATAELKQKIPDIEDFAEKICKKNGKPCKKLCTVENGVCTQQTVPSSLHVELHSTEWYKVETINSIFSILESKSNKNYMLVAGNTGHGVYRRDPDIEIFIDISDVSELKGHSINSQLIIGGNMTLTEAMELFYNISKTNKNFSYTKVLADHIDLVANVPVRNAGTIAGNLILKHEHPEFPSDIFVMLEAVDAKIDIIDKTGAQTTVSPLEYLEVDMKQKIIKSITLQPYDNNYFLKTYKIMPRAQNAHAYVNAGFLFNLDMKNVGKIISRPRIVFGGISAQLVHAAETERFLEGKNIFELDILQETLKILDSELTPSETPLEASPEYRKNLAEALLYKCVLSISPETVRSVLRSGGELLKRPLSSGKQDYDTHKELWPLGKPVPKIEALVQCSGEAKYVNDVLTIPGELYCAFAVTEIANGHIRSIDATDALAVPGVVAFYDAKDIPGKNNFFPRMIFSFEDEELFCSGNVKYNGQPVGVVVAQSHDTAVKAAKLVKIDYDVVNKPVIHLREVIKSGDKSRMDVAGEMKPTETGRKEKTKHVIKGSFDVGSQYHYTMETQCAVCIPSEDGLDVYPATQWMDLTHIAISEALKIPENSINMQVRRLGGGYGAKISRNTLVSTACALAAYLQNKPVRFIMTLEANMESIGKRLDCAMDYEVGVDDDGVITYLEAKMYHNCGAHRNDSSAGVALESFKNCYDNSTWNVTAYNVITDVAPNTWCRAPGTTEGTAFIENIMEHIAKNLEKDPIDLKMKNLVKGDTLMADMVSYWKTETNYLDRLAAVKKFNMENRWRKRGIAVVPMSYGFEYFGNFYAHVSIYARDGTVSVAHGGIECGQGVNTKVAQVCAHALGIPLEFVSVKPSNVLTAPNNIVTGGSVASESCAYATMRACEELMQRLAPVKAKLENPTWKDLIAAAYSANVDLCCSFMMYAGIADTIAPYKVYGVTVAEAEIDVLTGQHQLLRVDVLEDAGESLSPEVDIGQVEGAFVMGLGYWLEEFMVYDDSTGKALTNRTWNYKPPGVKDIPIDFRIQLRKNAPNPVGVLRSKATGEPPLCMSIVGLFAVREAVLAARQDAGGDEKWFEMNPPATPERVFLTSKTDYKNLVL
ncbi:uncharacterized protein LOC126100259 [Schistocerca cancellata]|uniref:uncharacterized protein LOC126100259 n=1 Tax=Schistocerca cancellata TaxID=274614 RepID=UPI002119B1A3|nr:uncharacterized protein LOC126100259 [Schistocerca cancellata]